MPIVVPSQVVAVIDQFYPDAKDYPRSPGGDRPLQEAPRLQSILSLVDAIPPELLTITPEDLGALFIARSAIDGVVAQSLARGGHPYFPWSTTVPVIRRVLALCPDEYPPAATADLAFIPDTDLRSSIRSDIGAADRAFSNAEWKAATVLAGGAIEALLHWKLDHLGNGVWTPAAVQVAASKGVKIPSSLDDWSLDQFLRVALELSVIKSDTETSARLAKDFRNLIHPGRIARLGVKCDRGTAHIALGALEHVVRDLS